MESTAYHVKKKEEESACENYLSGKARKAHRLRSDLEERLSAPQLEEHTHLLFIVQRVPQCWRLFDQHFYHFEDKVLS